MKLKRPSMITVFIVLGIVLIIAAIVIVISSGVVTSTQRQTDMTKISSISGEDNVMYDSDGNKLNSSKSVLSQKEVDGFVFDSFDISSNNGISTITFEIYNPSEEDKFLGEYELRVLDDYSNVIGRIIDNAGTLEGLSRIEVSLELKGDIANLTDIQISKVIYEKI